MLLQRVYVFNGAADEPRHLHERVDVHVDNADAPRRRVDVHANEAYAKRRVNLHANLSHSASASASASAIECECECDRVRANYGVILGLFRFNFMSKVSRKARVKWHSTRRAKAREGISLKMA